MRQIPPPILVSDPTQRNSAPNNQNQVPRIPSYQPATPSPWLTVESPSQQTQHISTVTTFPNNVRPPIQGIGQSPSQTIRSPIVRNFKQHQIPGRSISTFPFSSFVPKKQNAAPYPSLPSKLEISDQKNKVEQEILCLRAELSSLMHQWNFYNDELLSYTTENDSEPVNSINNQSNQDSTSQDVSERSPPNEESNGSSTIKEVKTAKSKTKHSTVLPTDITKSTIVHGVKEYHNILLSDPLIESVINSNREKKKESENAGFAHKISPEARFKSINDLPLYKTTIQDIKEIVAPVFAAHFESRELIKQKQEGLAKIYVESLQSNKYLQEKVDDYNIRVDSVSENWPAEFPKGKTTKTDDEKELLKWTAPDQPMLMTKTRLVTNCYYNMNGLVLDPVAAHEEYKNRISWSDDEKKKFVSKYMQHPKKFRLIADSLPLKSVKDVIEFYYVNRYTLSLKEKETARRKRGGKKKVISEGSAKTTK